MHQHRSNYLHSALPHVSLRVCTTTGMGDTDVELEVAVMGRVVYRDTDPNFEGMALSRDGEWLYVQARLPGRDREYRTYALPTGEEVHGHLHPSDPATYVLASDFECGLRPLGGLGDGRFHGGPFIPTHPARTAAASMSRERRVRWLEETLQGPPSAESWEVVAAIFERWTSDDAWDAMALAEDTLLTWPDKLRRRPEWLAWGVSHPFWELVVAPESSVTVVGRPLSAAVLRELLAHPSLAHLDSLELRRCSVDDAGARVIAEAESLQYLTTLVLHDNAVTDVGATALGASPHLFYLSVLDLTRCPVSREALGRVWKSPGLANLQKLASDGPLLTSTRSAVRDRRRPRILGAPTPKPTPLPKPGPTPPRVHRCVPDLEEILATGDLERRDSWGRTPLFVAVAPFGGCFECARRLVAAGADVNARRPSGESVVDELRAGVSAAAEHDQANRIEAMLREAGFMDGGES